MIRNKKIFQTEKLNELQQQQKRSLLIFPIIMAVLLIWGGPTSIAGLNGSNFVLGMTGMLLLAALAALVFGIVPLYMRYGIPACRSGFYLEIDFGIRSGQCFSSVAAFPGLVYEIRRRKAAGTVAVQADQIGKCLYGIYLWHEKFYP